MNWHYMKITNLSQINATLNISQVTINTNIATFIIPDDSIDTMEGADILETTNNTTKANITVNHNLTDIANQPITNEQEYHHITNNDIPLDITPRNNTNIEDKDTISDNISFYGNNSNDNFNNMDTQETIDQITNAGEDISTCHKENSKEFVSTETQPHEAQSSKANNNSNENTNKRRGIGLKYNPREKIKETRHRKFDAELYEYTPVKRNKRKTHDEYLNAICHLLVKVEKKQSYDKSLLHNNVMGLCMAQIDKSNLSQMHGGKGIKVFGDRAIEALAAEYLRLDGLEVFKPEDANKSTDCQEKA